MLFKSRFTTPSVAAISLCLIGGTVPATADILHVPGDFPTIQAAINAAVNGDEVVVADGLYTGPGNKDLNFGGKLITVRSENGPGNCIIDCEGSGRGFYFDSGETADAVVDGFWIRNGLPSSHGGGIFIDASSPTIRNCNVTGCEVRSSAGGGGIWCDHGSNPSITNCTIVGNTAWGGGGIGLSHGSHPEITGCTIIDNNAGFAGGGLECSSSNPIVTDCTFIGNSAVSEGGGIANLNNSTPTVGDSIFCENTPDHISGPYNDGGGNVFANADICSEPGEDDPPQQPMNKFGLDQDKRFLVFITHGWQKNPVDCPVQHITHQYLQDNVVPFIEQAIVNDPDLDLNEWQVIAHDWTDQAATGCSVIAANQALNHAMEIGKDLAEVISTMNYDYVHFIAHSAGTGMIAEAARNIDSPDTQTMCTYLDPFVGFPQMLPFGDGSHWSDEYFAADNTSIATDLPPKELHLVNVTWLDENLVCQGDECTCYSSHHWPVFFYRLTITGEIQIPDNEDCGDYGFGRSLEGGNHAAGMDEWSVDCLPDPLVDDAMLGEPPDGCSLFELLWDLLLGGMVDYLNDPYNTGEACVVDVNEDGSLDMQTCITLAAQGGFTVEPGRITVQVELEDNTNAVQFDVEFMSLDGAEGLLSVYWDGELLGSIDERFAAESLQTHTFGLPDEIEPGAYSLAFRLDGFTEVPSNAMLANVSTGLVSVVDPCPWDLDGSGSVGASDLLALLASWGPCKGCPADFDGNGSVGATDLLALLVNWGPCP